MTNHNYSQYLTCKELKCSSPSRPLECCHPTPGLQLWDPLSGRQYRLPGHGERNGALRISDKASEMESSHTANPKNRGIYQMHEVAIRVQWANFGCTTSLLSKTVLRVRQRRQPPPVFETPASGKTAQQAASSAPLLGRRRPRHTPFMLLSPAALAAPFRALAAGMSCDSLRTAVFPQNKLWWYPQQQ